MKYRLLFALVAILAIAACNKTPTTTNTTASILTTGSWKLSSGTVALKKPNGVDTTINYLSVIVPSCHSDDYIKFYSNLSGAEYPGTTVCSAAEPDSVSFGWQLTTNTLNIYNSQNFYYSVVETVLGYHFDTVSVSPLVLDSLNFGTYPSEIDSIHNLQFNWTPPPANAHSLVDITNATLTNVSTSSFTMNFNVYATYPDTTNFHQSSPIIRADTFHFSLTYGAQ